MRKLLLLLVMQFALHSPVFSAPAEAGEWAEYQRRFVSQDGRVIDDGQAQSSHSEGQGYGMLLAVRFDDRAAFDRLYKWAVDNLRKRPDRLFSWKWGRRADGSWGILDANNATDGDLLIAYALRKAAATWGLPAYDSAAAEIARDLRTRLARVWKQKSLLLPGAAGFERGGVLTVNPSYVIPRAYRALAGIDTAAFWNRLADDGEKLVYGSVFGAWGLPPDWLSLKKKAMPDPARGDYFGHDAIRVLLHTAEAGAPPGRLGLDALGDFVLRTGFLPERISLTRDEMSVTAASAGHLAVLARSLELAGRTAEATRLAEMAAVRRQAGDGYYASTLYLLARSGALE